MTEETQGTQGWNREQWCRKVIAEFREGDYVNLGFGLPILLANYRPADYRWQIHAENGSLGCGEILGSAGDDRDLVNPQGQLVKLHPGASFFSSAESFAMIRGGHIDVSVLGAYQVSQQGDLANWRVPGLPGGGVGGAMDLVSGAKRVIVMMEHRARNGSPKIVTECTLPLTGHRCVTTIVTNLAVIDVGPAGLSLREWAPGVSLADLRAWTGAPLRVVSAGRST